ncbi:MAG: hypothetical protein V7785_21015 [Bermanella sp.]
MKATDLPWIAMLLVVLLSGCGSNDKSEEAPEPQVTLEGEQHTTPIAGDVTVIAAGQDTGAANTPTEPTVVPEPLPIIVSSSLQANSKVASLEGASLVDILSRNTFGSSIPSIEGAWQQDCSQGENGESYNSRVIYQDGKVNLYAHNYSDAYCQTTLARIQMSGRYSLGQAAQLESGEQVNLLWQNISTIKAAYYGAVVISASNEMELCGIKNWSHGELQDVSDCDAFDVPAMEKNIIKVIGQQLVYGDSNSRGPDGYPSQLEEDVLFYKAPTQLEGNWLQECKVVGQSGQSRYLEVVGNSVLEQWTLFSDAGCDNILLSQTNAYQIDFGQSRILASGESVTQLYQQLFSSELTLHTSEITDYFNQLPNVLECGDSQWQQDETRDVLECINIQNAFPSHNRNIFKVTENEFTFGDENFIGTDGFSTQLEAQVFIRQ